MEATSSRKCSVEKTPIFHTVPQILKRNIFQKKNSLSAKYIVCGTERPRFEEHWVVYGSRTCKYSSLCKRTLRTELHKCVCVR